MSRAFQVIKSGTETNALVQRERSFAHSSGRHRRPSTKTPLLEQSSIKRSAFRSWAQLCPCLETSATHSSLIEGTNGHYNCLNCGALAF